MDGINSTEDAIKALKVNSWGKVRISLYLSPKIKEEMQALGKKKCRSMSNVIESLCQREIERESE